jgi:hypothetical protein
MRWIAVCVVWLALAPPVSGQSMDMQQLLAGKEIPFSLKLKDLDSNWRRLSISSPDSQKGGLGDLMSQILPMAMMAGQKKGSKDDSAEEALGMSFLSAMFGGGTGGSGATHYYTRGQTTVISGTTFLITYQVKKQETNFLQMVMDAQKSGGEPNLAALSGKKLTEDSELTLNLLNIQTINSLSDIRPFDMKQEIDESAQASNSFMDLINAPAAQKVQMASPPNVKEDAAALAATELPTMIESEFAADTQLSHRGNQIAVNVNGKTVVLRGHVRSATLKLHAGKIAQKELDQDGLGFTLKNQLVVSH